MRFVRTAGCLLLLLLVPAVPSSQNAPNPCDVPEATQFDFWIGEWDVHANGKLAGHNRITKIHNGCTLLEEYESAGSGYEGKSFNFYDATDGKWHQVWVDNGAGRLNLSGSYSDGVMVMSGERIVNGEEVIDRISWTENDDGTVRQHWESSKDGGKTWSTLFDGLYTRVESE